MSYHKLISIEDIESLNHGIKNKCKTSDCAQVWQSCDQYAYEVLHEDGMYYDSTGVQTKNACARFVYDRRHRTDIQFNHGEATNIVRFAGEFRHNKGKLNKKRIELMMWMIFVLGNMIGWIVVETKERRFFSSFLLVARANAKSFIASILANFLLLTSPNGEASAYGVARTQPQSMIVFNDAKKMIKSAPAKMTKHYALLRAEITTVANDGKYIPCASDPESLDGLRVAVAIVDELHAHQSADLLNTLDTGTSGTVDSMVFSISTAGKNLDGVCITVRNLVRDVNSNLIKIDTQFGIEFSIDDKDDWQDEETWKKANPSLGYAISFKKLKAEFLKAKNDPLGRRAFITKYCNRFVNTSDSPYLDINQVNQDCAVKGLDIKKFFGMKCYIGLDLAQKVDLASMSIIFPEEVKMTLFTKNFLPENALDAATPTNYERYIQFEDGGSLIVTPGIATDFEFIKDEIRWVNKHFDLEMVGYDPAGATQFALQMEKENIEMVEVKQNIMSLSEPAKIFQQKCMEGNVQYAEEDKCLEWCIGNASVYSDANENIKVIKDKAKPHDKIDPVISTITGLQIVEFVKPKPKNPYRKRGLITT